MVSLQGFCQHTGCVLHVAQVIGGVVLLPGSSDPVAVYLRMVGPVVDKGDHNEAEAEVSRGCE
jgi:hypothetical protein